MTIATSTVPTPVTFASFVEPVAAKEQLVCVAIKWSDNPGPTLTSVSNSCKFAANTFKDLSNGQLVYTPVSYEVSVPYTHSSTNVGKAVDYAKQQIQTQHGISATSKDVHWIVVNNNAPGENYSYTAPGGNTSNLLDALSVTFCHELGRQGPTVLGSSGAYENGKYVDQADATTFMGHFSSSALTASQLYSLGWLPNTQVAVYTPSTAPVEFTIEPLESNSNGIKAVLFNDPAVATKPLFLSRPTFNKNGILFALHLASNATANGPSNNRGSERLAVFAKQEQYKGLNIELVSETGNAATVRISPVTPATKPNPNVKTKAVDAVVLPAEPAAASATTDSASNATASYTQQTETLSSAVSRPKLS